MEMKHGARLVVQVGEQDPVAAVLYSEPADPVDSGFTVIMSDVPEDPLVVPEEEFFDRMLPLCLCCVIDNHPEAGHGLDLARNYGFASRNPRNGQVECRQQDR
jgi:hypothetical protein